MLDQTIDLMQTLCRGSRQYIHSNHRAILEHCAVVSKFNPSRGLPEILRSADMEIHPRSKPRGEAGVLAGGQKYIADLFLDAWQCPLYCTAEYVCKNVVDGLVEVQQVRGHCVAFTAVLIPTARHQFEAWIRASASNYYEYNIGADGGGAANSEALPAEDSLLAVGHSVHVPANTSNAADDHRQDASLTLIVLAVPICNRSDYTASSGIWAHLDAQPHFGAWTGTSNFADCEQALEDWWVQYSIKLT